MLTVVIAFYSDYAFRHWGVQKEKIFHANPNPRHVHDLKQLLRRRRSSALAILILAFGYIILAWLKTDPHKLPDWLSFLDVVYGPYLP
ncbi:MAG: hypothetical protein HQL74_10165 [Magnetococcales bacterium]|nr:hypothetical protein [Magnetococcales bacterium]